MDRAIQQLAAFMTLALCGCTVSLDNRSLFSSAGGSRRPAAAPRPIASAPPGDSRAELSDAAVEPTEVLLTAAEIDVLPVPEQESPTGGNVEAGDSAPDEAESSWNGDDSATAEQVSPRAPRSDDEADSGKAEALLLADVLAAVEKSFPLLDAAFLERQVAEGQQISARGAFDLQADAFSVSAPLGFYQTQRAGLELIQPLWNGGYAYGGYKIGRGNFPVWYGNRETNAAGEFNGGFTIPLLRDRAIDKRRAGIFKSNLGRGAVEPEIRGQQIEFARLASYAYWAWVAAGRKKQVAERLLEFADIRQDGIEKRVQRGDLPEIEALDNERLIVSRQAKLIDAQRKFRQAAIKLSLYYRDERGEPQIPAANQLPKEYPEPQSITEQQIEADVPVAIDARPELQELDLMAQQVEVEIELARNGLQPGLSAGLFASQDIGAPSSPKGDKVPFVMEALVGVDVPLQRREAHGKLRTSQGKRAQIAAKSRFVRDKIGLEVRNAGTAWLAASRQIERARESVELARQMEQAERRKYELGDSNLLQVNLREQQSFDAAGVEIEAFEDFFEAEADYRAAMAAGY